MADIIRIARDGTIENSRKDAILFLNNCNHLIGQQWQVRYYRDELKSSIDTIVAIGVKNGTGSECYRVVSYSYSENSAITDVMTDTLPDITDLIHGEIYIVRVNNVWNYVTLSDDTRYFDPITGGPYIYYNLTDGFIYYFSTDGVLRREDDFYTREELDKFITETSEHSTITDQALDDIRARLDRHDQLLEEHGQELDNQLAWIYDLDNVCFPMTVTVSANPGASTWASGTSHDIRFTFNAVKQQRDGTNKNVTSDCEFYYKLSTESSYHEATNPLNISGVTGINQTITYNFKGGNTRLFGPLKTMSDISYKFGYRVLYGVTPISGTFDINSLTQSNVTMKSTYYTATYTTTLNNLATFAVPSNWGTISKITDSSGITDYTSSFSRLSGTYSRTVDGITVTYTVYRWSSNPTVATNFTYRFYH